MPVYPSPEPLRVLAINGSPRPDSQTRKALRIALTGAAEAGAVVKLADLSSYDLGWRSTAGGLEPGGLDAGKLRLEIRSAHGLILGSPEYHGSFSGLLKNALDQFQIEDFAGKVVALVGAAGGRQGAFGALSGLRLVAKSLKTWVLPDEVSVAQAGKAFGEDGLAFDPALHQRLLELGAKAAQFASLHSGASALPKDVRTAAPDSGSNSISSASVTI